MHLVDSSNLSLTRKLSATRSLNARHILRTVTHKGRVSIKKVCLGNYGQEVMRHSSLNSCSNRAMPGMITAIRGA
jgi:hypothetical protein